MDPVNQAILLITQARQILSMRENSAAYHQTAQRHAVAISDFLAEHGPQLDRSRPDLVTNLGASVDALAKDASATLGAVQQSPTWAGIKAAPEEIRKQLVNGWDELPSIGKLAVVGLALMFGIRLLDLFKK